MDDSRSMPEQKNPSVGQKILKSSSFSSRLKAVVFSMNLRKRYMFTFQHTIRLLHAIHASLSKQNQLSDDSVFDQADANKDTRTVDEVR